MSAISSATIIETILSGARRAFETYQDLSGGHWVGNAPESFLQACIAIAFKELKDQDDRLYVTLEASTKRILADVDMKIDRRTVKMSDRERFDMLLWYKGGLPRAIIETKKAWNADSCNHDAKRIRQWIRAIPVMWLATPSLRGRRQSTPSNAGLRRSGIARVPAVFRLYSRPFRIQEAGYGILLALKSDEQFRFGKMKDMG